MLFHFPAIFSALRATTLAFGPRHTYWDRCPRCDRPTPWHTDAVPGVYRCARCGTPAAASR